MLELWWSSILVLLTLGQLVAVFPNQHKLLLPQLTLCCFIIKW